MMRAWGERTRSIDALERETETVRAALAALAGQAAAADNRAALAADALADVVRRLSTLETRVEGTIAATLSLGEQVDAFNTNADEQNVTVKQLRKGLDQIEGQMRIDAEEARKIGTGLWERIEHLQASHR